MENKEYNLDFYEALKIVMNGGAVKGDNFVDGVFLQLNIKGQLVVVDAMRMYEQETNVFIKRMVRQKFRELFTLTIKDLTD